MSLKCQSDDSKFENETKLGVLNFKKVNLPKGVS